PVIRPVDEISSRLDVVFPVPLPAPQLVALLHFQLLALARPGIEEVTLPSFRSYQQILWPLAVRIAVESRELHQRGQDSPTGKQPVIVAPNRVAGLAVIRGSRLRDERIDVVVLPPIGKQFDVDAGEVLRREDVVEIRERGGALLLDLIVRIGQSPYRIADEVVDKGLRER